MVTPDLKNQVFPPGNGRDLTNLIASLMGETVNTTIGYTPWKVMETMRDSRLFRAWFDALPDDLTGVDLSPLYLLAETASETGELRRRARRWEPNPDNLGDKYNGPIGEDGKPDRYLVSKWEKAVEKKRRAHLERFKADFDAMSGGDVPERLHQAATLLMELALNPEPATCGDFDEWDDCASAPDVVAAAAVRLCLAALCEIDEKRLDVARESLVLARVEAQTIANVEGVLS